MNHVQSQPTSRLLEKDSVRIYKRERQENRRNMKQILSRTQE